MAVEGKAGLETQGVAGAEPDGLGARRHQGVPKGRRITGGDEELEAERLSGVPGAAHSDLDGAGTTVTAGPARAADAQRDDAELVAPRFGQTARLEQAGEDLARRLALQGQHRDRFRPVLEPQILEVLREALEVRPVLVAVGGVDDEQELVLDEAVQVGVVDRAASLGGDDRVLRLQRVQRLAVVRQDVLEEGDGAAPAEHEAPHVRDVEQACGAPGREVLGDDPGRILHGHLPAREVDELRAGGGVPLVERRAPQGLAPRARAAGLGAAHCSAHALRPASPSSIRLDGDARVGEPRVAARLPGQLAAEVQAGAERDAGLLEGVLAQLVVGRRSPCAPSRRSCRGTGRRWPRASSTTRRRWR